jgi:hypothetical protein
MEIGKKLINAPKNTKLYSPIYGTGILTKVTNRIHVAFPNEHNIKCFGLDGKINKNGEVMLFPSKENRDWDTFYIEETFKNGDVIVSQVGNIVLFSHSVEDDEDKNKKIAFFHCILHPNNTLNVKNSCGIGFTSDCTLATKAQKERLFKALEEEGYVWDNETKRLVKIDKFDNKFNFDMLIPFDSRVLVRNRNTEIWTPNCWGFYNKVTKKFHAIYGGTWLQCVPYENNQHLLGTSNQCDDFYNIWI